MRFKPQDKGPLLAATLLAVAVSCALFSSCGDESETSAPQSPDDISADLHQTASALIVVRDIGGWWQDCGCSGPAQGGVGRLKAAASGIKNVQYLFVGQTILPYADAEKLDPARLAKATAWYAGVAAAVFDKLGDVVWFPSEAETQLLSQNNGNWLLTEYEHQSASFHWSDFAVVVEGNSIIVSPRTASPNDEYIDDIRFTLPPMQNRAREVGVLASWKAGGTDAPWVVSNRLAAAFPLAHQLEDARNEVRRELSSGRNLLAWWKRILTRDLNIEEPIDTAARGLGVLRDHSLVEHVHYVSSNGKIATADMVFEKCGKCHHNAYASWLRSKHADSMDTLRKVLKHSRPSCVPCHSTAYEVHQLTASTSVGDDAVACLSCHTGQGKPTRSICITCHTRITDPLRNFAVHTGDICDGKLDASAAPQAEGPCALPMED
jgi:hypothetical protein